MKDWFLDKKNLLMKKKSVRHPIVFTLLALLAALILSCVLSLILSTHGLTTSHYTVNSSKLTAAVRVVSLADIHGTVFGKDNARLIRRVREAEPDLIFIPGDLINKYDEDTSDEERLVAALSEIAPVYLSPGNHEVEYDQEHGLTGEESVLARFRRAGAHVLDHTYEDVEIKGQMLRIGGLHADCMPEQFSADWMLADIPFLKDFQNTDRYTMLLCHMPFSFLMARGLDSWKFDTVLSGHVHGGQVRFPFFALLSKYPLGKEDDVFPYWGGLWAPDQGRFPGRLEGIYRSSDGQRTLVLSRGLGSTEKLPRFNNIPEIVVVDYGPGT